MFENLNEAGVSTAATGCLLIYAKFLADGFIRSAKISETILVAAVVLIVLGFTLAFIDFMLKEKEKYAVTDESNEELDEEIEAERQRLREIRHIVIEDDQEEINENIENIEESIENLDLAGENLDLEEENLDLEGGSDEYRTEWEVISEPDDSGE